MAHTTTKLTLGAAAAAAVAVAALAPSSSGQAPGEETFELRLRGQDTRATLVDVAPRRGKRFVESPGDHAVMRAPLRDAAGRRIGTLHTIFTTTGGRNPKTTEIFEGVIVLDGGVLTIAGYTNPAVEEEEPAAVTGGTGRFAGVTGTVEPAEDRSGVTFTVRLRR